MKPKKISQGESSTKFGPKLKQGWIHWKPHRHRPQKRNDMKFVWKMFRKILTSSETNWLCRQTVSATIDQTSWEICDRWSDKLARASAKKTCDQGLVLTELRPPYSLFVFNHLGTNTSKWCFMFIPKAGKAVQLMLGFIAGRLGRSFVKEDSRGQAAILSDLSKCSGRFMKDTQYP